MKKLKITGIIFLVLIFLAIAGVSGYTAYYYNTYVDIDKVYPGISIGDMDVGGMTMDEAEKVVNDYVSSVKSQTITLEAGEKKDSFPVTEIGLECQMPDVVREAYDYGKSGNLYERIRTVYDLTETARNYPLTFAFDEGKARNKIIETEKTFLAKKKNATIKRKKGKFIVTEEVNGLDMDLDKNADQIIRELSKNDWGPESLVFPLDYTEDKAEHTKKQLSVIKDKLGTFTTSYAGSASGRCVNVANGARLINDSLLYPGDTLSVHDKVSPFNKENGYELAGSYENGTTVQTYGGGICQVSTTLYNAVLRAELEVLERSNHSMTVHYVKLSEDAAISGDDKDFKFKNNLKDPVYIVGSTDAGAQTITFTIYGKEYREKDRSIEFESETIKEYPPKEEIIKDDSMKKGKKEVEKSGHTGYSARLWKIIRVKGKEYKREQVNSSYYISTPKVVRIGTKEEKKEEPKKTEDSTKTGNENSNETTEQVKTNTGN
ncbi:MAG: VanW family protein [Eubacterium sp.]|nr:VanW family protein [Eubacterium sp.]